MKTRAIASATLVSLVATSCGGRGAGDRSLPAKSPLSDQVLVQTKGMPAGLDLRVSDGKQSAPAYDHANLAPAKRIADADAQQLLNRAKPITVDTTDQQAFALRPKSQPPPRTGKTVTGQFPPPASTLLPPTANDAGKDLSVLRYMPEGAVPLAPELSVTFSQPMVAVTSQDDAAKVQPVKLTPTPKGRWRWIGTRTILFDPDVRFPQATTYKIEIPAGTKSTSGGELKKPVAFSFETPPPTLRGNYPYSGTPQHLDVPMFALFDQKIDPAAVLQTIHVNADGKAQQIRLMEPAEIAKDKQLGALVEAYKKDEQDGRWVAFRTTNKLPADASVDVEIGEGTPSAEGPNKTKTAQHFGFRTYAPLKVVRAQCGWGECRPNAPLTFEMNNPLDVEKFDESWVTISPTIGGAKIIQQGNYVIVNGATKARSSYKVTLSQKLLDEFGQTLGKDESHDFAVGDANPTFYGPSGLVVLDPAAKKPTLDVFSTNYDALKVRLYKVEPSDYDAFAFYLRNQWNHDHPPSLPGTKVMDKLVRTSSGKNELVETAVELQAALKSGGFGHAIAIVEPSPWLERYEPPRLVTWVQATHLAVDAYVDYESMVVFATELDTGKPASGVSLEIRPFGITGKTDDRGMATLPLGTTAIKGQHYLVAKRGDDVAFVTDDSGYYNEYGSWHKQGRASSLAWYVVDDRQMYRPGEEVSLKGWLRAIDYAKNGDVGGISGDVTSVSFKVHDSQGNQIAQGSAPVSAVGGFDAKFTIPKTPNLGYANIVFESQGRRHEQSGHMIQIQEFRRPEFQASAEASQGPFVVGQSGDVTINAKYFAGGPLGGAPVNWYVTAGQTNFTPPNRDEYIFGNWQPWWGYTEYSDDEGGYGRGHRYKPPKTWQLASKTDAAGSHVLHLDFLSVNPAMPMSVVANATVTDVNRQQVAANATLIVHPSTYYVGLKTKKPFVDKGVPFPIEVIGVDLDGKPVVGAKIEVKAARLDWEYKHGKYTTKEVDVQTCAVTAADKASPCEFATKEGGTYTVTATIVDAKGRPNQTKMSFWVSGGEEPPAREVKKEKVQIIPDKKEYKAGDTAELLVMAPFYPAEAVVSWRRSGIVKIERLTMSSASATIKVPITEGMVPNLFVQVDLVGMATRSGPSGDPDPKLPKRTAYAVGTIDLSVPPKQRTLAVTVAPKAAKLGPGEKTTLAVDVKDANGKPLDNAEVAILVVDEAILSLTGYQFGNPIDTFYGQRGADVRDFYLQAYVKLARPDVAAFGAVATTTPGGANGAVMMDGAPPPPPASPAAEPMAKSERARDAPEKKPADSKDRAWSKNDEDQQGQQQPHNQAIAVRSNFNPLAAFVPAVKTDGRGHAIVDIQVPDNLTRYRIVAIAAYGDKQFGKGESAITARLPLMVRPSPPRFLNFGDTFRLPVVVQNQTDSAMTVRVAVRATNAAITDGYGREFSVPANDRVEVQFPAAAEMAGTARFQIVGSAGSYSDASEIALPVWTPATTEAFATYGVIDDGAIKQQVALPEKVVTQFGGLEVTTASTNLQSLTDAFLYLVHYPFECAEQRSSRILAIAALRDVLSAFKVKDMPSVASMEKSVDADLEHLSQMQNYDGGFAYWDRGYPSEPYLTVYVANALSRAKAKGFTVPANMIERVKPYLKEIEKHYPTWYPDWVRHEISSYALYTRKLMGDVDVAKAQKLLREAGGPSKLAMEANGWLIGVFAGSSVPERKELVRYAMNHVSETAGAANFTTAYGDGKYLLLGSDRRVDGVMLESLIQEDEKLDLIPKIVTGLLAHKKAGRWLNTQENTFILLALDRYFHTYEKVTPDFVARAWLGDDYAGDHAFKGRTTEYFQINIPMKDVATHDKADLTIQKDGRGRLYYRVGMTYAPATLKLAAADYGFVVERSYEAVDDPKDVRREADGTWHVKAGARVRVRLKMVNENRRYHVALVDPMPAGFEAMNPALATTGPIPRDPAEQQSRGAYWWWYGPWYDHQNMRDERTEAFSQLLWEGVHKYDYVARATTPGTFIVPPTKAEEMYMPETFGRSASDRVVVE